MNNCEKVCAKNAVQHAKCMISMSQAPECTHRHGRWVGLPLHNNEGTTQYIQVCQWTLPVVIS